MTSSQAKLAGEIFLLTQSKLPIAHEQIALLAAIDDTGSITQAAKQVGISYRTAWDRVETMNNLSESALVSRSTGGAQGGGTLLTELGKRVVAGFQRVQAQHQQFIEQLGQQIDFFSDVANFMKTQTFRTSARNQFQGIITRLTPGAVNAEVQIDIGAAQTLVAIITQESVTNLQLAEGKSVIALIKASSILLSADSQIATSARNQLTGRINRIMTGAVNTDVVIELAEGKSISAIISNISADSLGFKEGHDATALFKASSVILIND